MSTHFHVSGTGVTGPLARRSGNYKWWVLATAIFGAFVSILDTTIVNTALPHIQRAFGSDLHMASYVTTAYTLAQGVIIAASGFLANRFGIKRVYLLSLALFTLGSALCGIAWNIQILILFRVLQGASGAALFPLSLSLIFGAFPEEQRGLANGIFGIPVLVAPAFGPVIGGYLAEYVDWRWIFYVNVPIGLLGIVICWRMLHESELQPTLPFDLRGFLLIASGLGLLLFGLSNLAYDGWGSLLTVTGPVILALLLVLLFIPIELRTARPLLDVRLFQRRNFLVGNLITWVAVASLFGSTFLLPQYLQVLRGLSSYNAGLLLAPQGLASIVGTIVVGMLYSRVGPRPLVLAGGIAVGIGTYLISRWVTLTSPFALLIPLLVVMGLAFPFIAQATSTAALTGIEGTALPGANTLLGVSRSVVSSLTVAGLVNIVQAQRLVHQAALAHNGPVTVAITQQAQALAYQDVYLLSALVTLPLLVLAFFLSSRRRAQQPEPTTTFGVSPQTPEAAIGSR
jgi:EmrB/QacA subfamily drug resistance transporter